ncbi:MAG: DUF951 domain-containing protein [Armatimonadota bacterium]
MTTARGRLPLKLYVGDVMELKKPHACGANAWEIVRLGMDIRVKCRGCGRITMLPRVRVERRLRRFLERPQAPPETGRDTP